MKKVLLFAAAGLVLVGLVGYAIDGPPDLDQEGGEAVSASDDEEEVEDPTVSVSADHDGGDVTVDVSTNLPDGALVGVAVFDTAVPDSDPDAESMFDFAEVDDGHASLTVDAAAFTSDDALVEATFVPSYNEQPDVVTERYDADAGAADEQVVSLR